MPCKDRIALTLVNSKNSFSFNSRTLRAIISGGRRKSALTLDYPRMSYVAFKPKTPSLKKQLERLHRPHRDTIYLTLTQSHLQLIKLKR